ncbi:MAG TPA: inositol monophosphatase family protein, partial [Fimbriimonadaceae bacterium]|nr:inositol monophosphatase family protein [Fimbriimonadaceae bacterium]
CWGEELGREEPAQAGFWVLDPIDGTSNYIFGLPSWGTSVALVRKGRVELGVVHLPVWEETFACARESGVFRNGEIMATVPAGRIRPEELVSASGAVCKWVPPRLLPGKMRCSGAFVADAAHVLTQRMRGLIGIREKLYDMAASWLMAEELGMDVRYAAGGPLLIEELILDKAIDRPWVMFPKENEYFLTEDRGER